MKWMIAILFFVQISTAEQTEYVSKIVISGQQDAVAENRPELLNQDKDAIGDLVGMIDGGLSRVYNVGRSVWDLIMGGFNEAEIESVVAAALPTGLTLETAQYQLIWNELPVELNQSIEVFSNLNSRSAAVKYDFKVVADCGGTMGNAPEQYLTNIHVKPVGHPTVGYGWKFSGTVTAMNPVMVRTSKGPVARILLKLNYRVKPTFGRARKGELSYMVFGDCRIKAL